MEKCETEVNEESKIKMEEPEEESVQKLGNHLGKLLVLLELAGIPIAGGRNNRLLDLLIKFCFPIFLHLSCIYLLYERLRKAELTYGIVIDTILPILPCVMWIMMRCQIVSLRSFLADLGRATSSNFKASNRILSFSTNAAICFIFLYPVLLLGLRFAQGNVVNVVEVFRILQEALVPNTMAIAYIAVCYLIVQKLRSCKETFQNKLDLACPSALNLMTDYLNVTKCVESFENLLSNMTLVILLHDLLVVTILLIDTFYVDNFVESILYEALAEILYVFFSLLTMAVCAGNVSFEIAAIKSVLSEKMFNQLGQSDVSNVKHVNLLLKKDVFNLTIGKAIVFDRGFIVKMLLAVLIEVTFISQFFNR